MSLPNLFFAIRLGVSEGFNFGKATLAILGEGVICVVSWALGHSVTRRSVVLLIVSSVLVMALLIAYVSCDIAVDPWVEDKGVLAGGYLGGKE